MERERVPDWGPSAPRCGPWLTSRRGRASHTQAWVLAGRRESCDFVVLPTDDLASGGMTVGVQQWPLILAGPIVRRVEPGLVAVWVALKAARAVRLSVWQGATTAGAAQGLFAGPAPLVSGRRGDDPRRRAVAHHGRDRRAARCSFRGRRTPTTSPSARPAVAVHGHRGSEVTWAAARPARLRHRRRRPAAPRRPRLRGQRTADVRPARRPTSPGCGSPTDRAAVPTPRSPTCSRRSTH